MLEQESINGKILEELNSGRVLVFDAKSVRFLSDEITSRQEKELNMAKLDVTLFVMKQLPGTGNRHEQPGAILTRLIAARDEYQNLARIARELDDIITLGMKGFFASEKPAEGDNAKSERIAFA